MPGTAGTLCTRAAACQWAVLAAGRPDSDDASRGESGRATVGERERERGMREGGREGGREPDREFERRDGVIEFGVAGDGPCARLLSQGRGGDGTGYGPRPRRRRAHLTPAPPSKRQWPCRDYRSRLLCLRVRTRMVSQSHDKRKMLNNIKCVAEIVCGRFFQRTGSEGSEHPIPHPSRQALHGRTKNGDGRRLESGTVKRGNARGAVSSRGHKGADTAASESVEIAHTGRIRYNFISRSTY